MFQKAKYFYSEKSMTTDEEAFTTYSPYIPDFRTKFHEWMSSGSEGEFALQSINVRVPPPFKNLSDYYRSFAGKSLMDFFTILDNMFPEFKLGYRYNGIELSFYLTKS